ncbi:MAG: acyltransferase [Jannaschia helgolandensis]|uniref:acyltransferase n=1 Tax=Jannaschia helgolandensis TaxID=188906 RepID=UPI003C795C2E
MSWDIAPDAHISPMADLEISSKGSVLRVAEGVMIDAFVKIKMAGGTGDVTIGENSYLNSGCVIYSGHGVTIGRDVLIAANCTIAATNHAFDDPSRPICMQGFQPSRGGIIVEDDVWIGANCVLLDGAHIGRGSVIAAGSIVRSRLNPATIFAGTPLRAVRPRGDTKS